MKRPAQPFLAHLLSFSGFVLLVLAAGAFLWVLFAPAEKSPGLVIGALAAAAIVGSAGLGLFAASRAIVLLLSIQNHLADQLHRTPLAPLARPAPRPRVTIVPDKP